MVVPLHNGFSLMGIFTEIEIAWCLKNKNKNNVLKKKVVTVYSFLFIEYQFSWFFLIPSNHEI
jgi:hypothetical protein